MSAIDSNFIQFYPQIYMRVSSKILTHSLHVPNPILCHTFTSPFNIWTASVSHSILSMFSHQQYLNGENVLVWNMSNMTSLFNLLINDSVISLQVFIIFTDRLYGWMKLWFREISRISWTNFHKNR